MPVRVRPEAPPRAGFFLSAAGEDNVLLFRNVVLSKASLHPKPPYVTETLCHDVIANAVRSEVQPDGRIRYWGQVGERWLRVVVLEDGETLHNAFYDRRFKP